MKTEVRNRAEGLSARQQGKLHNHEFKRQCIHTGVNTERSVDKRILKSRERPKHI